MLFRMGHCIQCGKCCKYLVHCASKEQFNDSGDREYYSWKGTRFIEYGNKWVDAVLIKAPCKNLKKHKGKHICKVHGTEKEPKMCRIFPNTPHDFHNVMITMGCGVYFEEIDVEAPNPLG